MKGLPLWGGKKVTDHFAPDADAVMVTGDCIDTLRQIPNEVIKLVVTSPPYNLDKVYETPAELDQYLALLRPVVDELMRVLSPEGSVCWQVGNYVEAGEIFPLDIIFYPFFKQHGLKLRNRIIWHFEHGLHASRRFSGRYETLLWFTKGERYTFNLDAVRVPAKYPGKRHYKGEKYGQPSGNPLGKNPSDLWRLLSEEWELGIWDIPNVKANHPEKTVHPCQFPIELVERCVLALTNAGDWVLDPFAGVGSTLVASLLNNRRVIACEKDTQYVTIAHQRLHALETGTLRYRRIGKPVFQPTGREKVSQVPLQWLNNQSEE
jgi:adenine-specific DNA-methyltransferase